MATATRIATESDRMATAVGVGSLLPAVAFTGVALRLADRGLRLIRP